MSSAKPLLTTLGQPLSYAPCPLPPLYHLSSGAPSKSATTTIPQPPFKFHYTIPLIAGTQPTSARAWTTKPAAIALGDHPTQQNTFSLSAPSSPITANSSSATIHTGGSSPPNRAAMPLPNSSITPNNFSGPCPHILTLHDSVCISVLGTDLFLICLHCFSMDNPNSICSTLIHFNQTLSP